MPAERVNALSCGVRELFKRKCISMRKRKLVYEKCNHRCAYCGCELNFESMHVDHVEPISRGGQSEVSNYLPACSFCNIFKSDYSVEEFRENIVGLRKRLFCNCLAYRVAEQYGMISFVPHDVRFYFETLEEEE